MFLPEQYRSLREAAGLVDRSSRGRLRLSGGDRRDYLQGLLTNDIVALAAGSGCYACLLTAQGRMVADMYVLETGEDILIDLEGFVAARVAEHLDRFVFSEDVEVSELTGSTSQLGVFGPRAASAVAQALNAPSASAGDLEAMPVLGNRAIEWNGTTVTVVRRDDLGGLGFDLIVARDTGSALTSALVAAGASVVDPDAAEVCRVEAGLPVFGQDMTEDTIPLEAGIQDRAISLTKGCYVGQEIIIRVLHRGHGRVARRLVGLTFRPEAAVPAAGASIRSGEREIGSITSAVLSPALQHPIALGYVHRDFVAPGTEVTVLAADQAVEAVVASLPFTDTVR
jgi:folate-binding protein YgfZ